VKEKKKANQMSNRKAKGIFLNRKGQSLLEFAFVLTIFIVLFCFLVGLVQIAYNWVVLQYAASEGSRFGSLGIIEPGFATREENIRSRVLQITAGLGIADVIVEFVDQAGGASAGAASEYFRMKLTHTLALQGIPGFFFEMGGFGNGAPSYEVTTWTVIRNEPF
jgi:hypothetical protein